MSNDIKRSIANSMDCLHASEDTYEEAMAVVNKNTRSQKRMAFSWVKIAAVALVAVLVIGTGAYAAATGVFENLFGLKGYEDVEPGDHIKGVQYIDVSAETAAVVVDDNVHYVNQSIEHDGYVLTVHAYVVDENGCAMGWATLSNENGISADYIHADGHLFKHDMIGPEWEGPFQYVVMTASDGNYVNDVDNGIVCSGHNDNHTVAINRETATDTSLDLVFYYASGDCRTPGGIEFRMGFSEETWGFVDTVVKTDSFAVTNVLDAVDCGSFSVSPISIKHKGTLETIHNLSVNYTDGTGQCIINDYYYNVALDNANLNNEQLYIPTALLETGRLESVHLIMRDSAGNVTDRVFTPAE